MQSGRVECVHVGKQMYASNINAGLCFKLTLQILLNSSAFYVDRIAPEDELPSDAIIF